MWLKYWSSPINRAAYEDKAQPDELSSYSKPVGCWITDDTEDCWRSWCLSERFSVGSLTHKHEVVLDESNILILRSVYELDMFANEFGDRRRGYVCINWPMVAARYDGMIVTPYQYQRRLHDGFSWYYTWDCASGCIWRASSIKDIRLISVDLDVAKEAA